MVNCVLAMVLASRGASASALLAFVPLLIVLFGMLVSSKRAALLAAALGLSMTVPALQKPLPLPFPGRLYGADLVVLLALVAWLARRLTMPASSHQRAPSTPLLGPALVFFATVTLWAAFRGHYAYGANLFGEPVRLFGYALLVFAFVDLNPRTTYRTIVTVFYAGAVWMFMNAVYYFATGTSQTDQIDLSTGGKRVLSLGTAIYLSGALFLRAAQSRNGSLDQTTRDPYPHRGALARWHCRRLRPRDVHCSRTRRSSAAGATATPAQLALFDAAGLPSVRSPLGDRSSACSAVDRLDVHEPGRQEQQLRRQCPMAASWRRGRSGSRCTNRRSPASGSGKRRCSGSTASR